MSLALALTATSRAADKSPRDLVTEGNTLVAKGEFQKALDAYQSAEVSMPDTAELAYNQGIARYKLKDYAKAREQFNKALATRDLPLEAKAKYNLGNCAYVEILEKLPNLQAASGKQQKLKELQAAIDGLRQAINHYRDALELNPKDNDARANIETAQLLIKDLLDKQKEEEQRKDEDQQNQEQQEQQKQEQQKNPESQPSSQPSQQDQQQQEQQEQQQQGQSQNENRNGSEQQEQQEAQEQKGEQKQMSQQEAERLLQAVRDREKEHKDKQAKAVRVRRVPVTKDW